MKVTEMEAKWRGSKEKKGRIVKQFTACKWCGELRPKSTGRIYCRKCYDLIAVCDEIGPWEQSTESAPMPGYAN
jgi:hypothetical protein